VDFAVQNGQIENLISLLVKDFPQIKIEIENEKMTDIRLQNYLPEKQKKNDICENRLSSFLYCGT
jgi:hypothetical protein